MNSINLEVLYQSKIIADIVLVFFALYIFKDFRKTYRHSYLFPLYRFLILVGFYFTYIGFTTRSGYVLVFSSFILYAATETLIRFLSITYGIRLHVRTRLILFIFFIIGFILTFIRQIFSGNFILTISVFSFIQFFSFYINYFVHIRKNSEKHSRTMYFIILLSIYHLVNIIRPFTSHRNTVTLFLQADLMTSVLFVLCILIDLVITFSISNYLYRHIKSFE